MLCFHESSTYGVQRNEAYIHSLADNGELEGVSGKFNHPRSLLHLHMQVRKTIYPIRVIIQCMLQIQYRPNIEFMPHICNTYMYITLLYYILCIFANRSRIGKVAWFLVVCASLAKYLQKMGIRACCHEEILSKILPFLLPFYA